MDQCQSLVLAADQTTRLPCCNDCNFGFEPIRVETATGKAEHAVAQRTIAERGAPLRERLVEECDRLLSVAG